MKKFIFTLLTFFYVIALDGQQIFVITHSGFTFTPSTVTVNQGDIVRFNVSSAHPVVQVSQATWIADGNTPLPGGFSFPSGAGDYTATTPGTFYYVCDVHFGLAMKGTIFVNTVTGIGDIPLESRELWLFPNPARDWLIVQTEKYIPVNEITIVDIMGKTIMQFKKPESSGDGLRIDVENLNNGLYFVRVKSDNRIISGKFLKS